MFYQLHSILPPPTKSVSLPLLPLPSLVLQDRLVAALKGHLAMTLAVSQYHNLRCLSRLQVNGHLILGVLLHGEHASTVSLGAVTVAPSVENAAEGLSIGSHRC